MNAKEIELDESVRLGIARDLVKQLECGSEGGAEECLRQLLDIRESFLFDKIGKLTRQLHDALIGVGLDSRMVGIAENEIPDAKKRLHYVITKTEESANKTLAVCENLLPLSGKIYEDARSLLGEWSRFKRREMNLGEFKELSRTLSSFLESIEKDSAQVQSGLNEVLLAQDFQDLTGQVIKKVLDTVQQVEDSLVELIRVTGWQGRAVESHDTGTKAEGPPIDRSKVNMVSGQDEVDDLLSSLGF